MKTSVICSAVLGLVALGAVGYATRSYLRPRMAPILPAMTEPPPGPRAPDNRFLGAEIGKTTFERLSDRAEALGCVDTSARALMLRARAKKKAARAAKIAAGQAVDAVSAASSKKVSPMMRNPQVRLSCENTEARGLDARDDDVRGRALFVFDSPEHPLRHASFRRLHADAAEGAKDARRLVAGLTERFGPAHAQTAAWPEPGAAFAAWTPYTLTWAWADLEVKATVVSYGRRGFSVYEVMQVPLPIRPDAPARPRLRASR